MSDKTVFEKLLSYNQEARVGLDQYEARCAETAREIILLLRESTQWVGSIDLVLGDDLSALLNRSPNLEVLHACLAGFFHKDGRYSFVFDAVSEGRELDMRFMWTLQPVGTQGMNLHTGKIGGSEKAPIQFMRVAQVAPDIRDRFIESCKKVIEAEYLVRAWNPPVAGASHPAFL